MTILVDCLQEFTSGKWCHMWSEDSDRDELDAFAIKIGLKKAFAQDRPNFYHYDLRPSKRKLAIKLGAQEMALSDWVRVQPYFLEILDKIKGESDEQQ